MRKAQIKKADVPTLVVAYVDAAVAQGKALEVGDHRRANPKADLLSAIFAELRRRGLEAQQALLPLLRHPDPSVRCWAGAHALEFAPEQGEPVLAELAPTPRSFVALAAHVTLEQWRKGELRFP